MKYILSIMAISLWVLPLTQVFATPEQFQQAEKTYKDIKNIASLITDNLKYLDPKINYKVDGKRLIPDANKAPESFLKDLNYIPSLQKLNDAAKAYYNTPILDYSWWKKNVSNSFKGYLTVVPEQLFKKIKEIHRNNNDLQAFIETLNMVKENLSNLLFKMYIIKSAKTEMNSKYIIEK